MNGLLWLKKNKHYHSVLEGGGGGGLIYALSMEAGTGCMMHCCHLHV